MEIISETTSKAPLVFMIFMILLAIAALVLSVWGFKDKDKKFGFFATLLSVFLLFSGIYDYHIEHNKKTIKAIVHNMDDVNLNKYELKGNDGKIIILKEK